jgi:hypothetical protein
MVGTKQDEDVLCWEDPKHPKWRFQSSVTDDGKVILSSLRNKPQNFHEVSQCIIFQTAKVSCLCTYDGILLLIAVSAGVCI